MIQEKINKKKDIMNLLDMFAVVLKEVREKIQL